jgi:HEAT repeat protein
MNPGTPDEALERSDAVFMGEIVAVEPSLEEEAKNKEEGKFIFITDYEYEVKVEKAWKGVWGDTAYIEIGVQGTACGLGRLKVGQRFLFYAYGSATKNFFLRTPFHTSSCSRTRPADYAVVEALFLGAAAGEIDPAPIYRQLPTILKSHDNPLYRAAAARYLRYDTPSPFPEGTVDALLAGLRDLDPMVRKTVAGVITGQNFKRHHKIWRSALSKAFEIENKRLEKNPESIPIREAFRSIADALVVYGDREARLKAVSYFVLDLKNEKSVSAIYRLRNIGPDAQAAVPVLKQMLEHKDKYIRNAAMEALRTIQAQGSLKEIIKGLDDDDCRVVKEAVKALDQVESPKARKLLNEKGIPRLIEKRDSSPCMFLRYVLGELGVPLTPHVPQMIEVLSTPVDITRSSITRVAQEDLIEILGNIGPKAHRAVPVLEKALNDPHEGIRRAAERALYSIKALDAQRPKPTLAELKKQLVGPETPEWYRTVRQIQNLENPKAWKFLNREVVPRLIRKWKKGKLKDQESQSLVKCLEELSPQVGGVYPIFLDALKHPDNTTQLYAVIGLRKLGKAGEPAVPQLIKLLKESKESKVLRDWFSHSLVLTLK